MKKFILILTLTKNYYIYSSQNLIIQGKNKYNQIKKWFAKNPTKSLGTLSLILPGLVAAMQDKNELNTQLALVAITLLATSAINLLPGEF